MSTLRRVSLAALLLAASAFAGPAAFAQGQPVAHPSAHPAHPVSRPVRPGTYRVVRPGFHPAPYHGPAHFAARVHPFHSIIMRRVPFARFTAAERATWTHGRWFHRSWHGRYGWWWYAGGVWFWYSAPVYPYPTVVSDDYYEEPEAAGPTWWYCYNPAGYYPYVPACYGPWTPVPAQGYGQSYQGYDEQSGPDQGPPPGYDQGPPPGDSRSPPDGH